MTIKRGLRRMKSTSNFQYLMQTFNSPCSDRVYNILVSDDDEVVEPIMDNARYRIIVVDDGHV